MPSSATRERRSFLLSVLKLSAFPRPLDRYADQASLVLPLVNEAHHVRSISRYSPSKESPVLILTLFFRLTRWKLRTGLYVFIPIWLIFDRRLAMPNSMAAIELGGFVDLSRVTLGFGLALGRKVRFLKALEPNRSGLARRYLEQFIYAGHCGDNDSVGSLRWLSCG